MDEKWFERAEKLSADERADAIAEAQRAVGGTGQDDCDECGELIPPDRRLAAPFATRCLACQQGLELHRRAFRSPLCNFK